MPYNIYFNINKSETTRIYVSELLILLKMGRNFTIKKIIIIFIKKILTIEKNMKKYKKPLFIQTS